MVGFIFPLFNPIKIQLMRETAGFTFDKMLHTMPDEAYDIIMKVHVRAPFRLVRAAAPYFRVKVMSHTIHFTYWIGLNRHRRAKNVRIGP
jgi:NAD(P)-dependent dehydrogenase (short-subunit alcohol dehydrogenase family)